MTHIGNRVDIDWDRDYLATNCSARAYSGLCSALFIGGRLTVHISLFSNDSALVTLLRDAIGETLGSEFTLEVRSAGQPAGLSQLAARDGLYVWDFVPGETVLPQDIVRSHWRTSLFLLHRKDLAVLKTLMGDSEVNVLLKPVDPAGLRAFLGGYSAHRSGVEDDAGASAATLRSERDEVLQILMQANLKLQEFHQERTNFLARSIHDFRAPLTAISGYCELLLSDELEPLTPGQRKILQRMQYSVRRLTRATNSMSRLGLAENAEPTVNLEQADIHDCVGRALEGVAAILQNRRISVNIDIGSPPENLLFEASQIEQVLVTLLESACKFTPRGGTVEIRGYPFFWERRSGRTIPLLYSPDLRTADVKTSNSFRVDISDSGPAIRAVDADSIFEQYTSYSGGQDRSGAGLGMAICRMILSQHSGRVWAESSETGAIFSFVLPLSPMQPPTQRGESR